MKSQAGMMKQDCNKSKMEESMYREIKKKVLILKNRKPYSREISDYIDEMNRTDWISSCLRLSGTPVSKENVEKIGKGELLVDVSLKTHQFIHRYADVIKEMQSMADMGSDLSQISLNRLYKMLFHCEEERASALGTSGPAAAGSGAPPSKASGASGGSWGQGDPGAAEGLRTSGGSWGQGDLGASEGLRTSAFPSSLGILETSGEPGGRSLAWEGRRSGASSAPAAFGRAEAGERESACYRRNNPVLLEWGYNPPHFNEIEEQMDILFHWLATERGGINPDINPIMRAVMLHNKLVEIYPFGAHSASMARAAMLCLLMEAGLPPIRLDFSEQEYNEAIVLYLKREDCSPLYETVEKGVFSQLSLMIQLTAIK